METFLFFLKQHITGYALLGFTGLVTGGILCYFRCKKFNIDRDDVFNLFGYALVGAIVGSKLMAWLYICPNIIKNWEKITWTKEFILALGNSGFVYYGGFIGVVIMFLIYSKQFDINIINILELAAPAIPLFHAIGRIGCYTAGCCGGINGFPLQLVEATMNIIIAVLILILQNRNLMVNKTFIIYLWLYGSGRFILEFFRGDAERWFIGVFSVSQWISIALIIVGLLMYKRTIMNIKKTK